MNSSFRKLTSYETQSAQNSAGIQTLLDVCIDEMRAYYSIGSIRLKEDLGAMMVRGADAVLVG